ncbi:hypothetical protein INT47_007733 [Mucor saturninus]|uniref:ATP synthase mitochondrial F1 complex assembly factor 1 n=1 Tax=Mucor saturninus TaxID=64648 RepID=A0A8H7QWP5_9FUNG|nr:hypothetical protein INT47_007733 [Mucor saturninus]
MIINVNKHTVYNRKITEQRERYGVQLDWKMTEQIQFEEEKEIKLENERIEEARRRLMRKFREDNMTSNEVEDDGHDEEKRAKRRPRKRNECEKEEAEERLNDEVQRASKIGKKRNIFDTLTILHNVRITSNYIRQIRHAEIVNSPSINLFGGHYNNWDRIKCIANEANRVKVDYDTKYALKLREAAQKRGVTMQELKTSISKIKKATPKSTSALRLEVKKEADPVKRTLSTAPTLDSIVKLDLLLKEDNDKIIKIWTQYNCDKDGIYAVIPVATYSKMYQTSQKYSLFILPLPRETGLEFFFLQFQSHQCNLTSLLEYKTKRENARPFLTITHYPELSESKGIVLMRGDINDKPKKMLTNSDAHYLAFALQQFYSTDDPHKIKLVHLFNTLPEKFDYHMLIKEMESVVPLQ